MSDYDEQGRLTRTAAVKIIQAGGSVSIGGKIYGTVDTLPNEAEFAKGNAKAEVDARKRLEQQRAALDAQIASLPAATAETTTDQPRAHKRV